MAQHDRSGRGRHRRRSTLPAWRPLAGATIGLAVLVASGPAVWAALSATASAAPQSAEAGTLRLTLAANGAGFAQPVSGLAPGDVVQRYVDLTNGGTLAGQALSLAVTATGSSALVTDGATTRALRLSVNGCTGTWTPTTGACSGTVVPYLAATPVGSLSTPATLVAGAVPAGAVLRLQVLLQLPNQDETTTNGAPPTATVQGQTASLSYVFSETQRTAATTTS